MIGEPLWESILLWPLRKFVPYRIRKHIGVYTFSELILIKSGEEVARGFAEGLREYGLNADDFFGLRD